MKCLITGAGGFIGGYLAEYLLKQGQAVVAVSRRQGFFSGPAQGKVETVHGDLLDDAFIEGALRKHEPEIIFHLAAQTLPQVAWREPALTYRSNVIGSLKLFQAALQLRTPPLIIAASSSSIYAPEEGAKLLDEEAPLSPDSIYSASKISQEQLGRVFSKSKGLKIIFARPFFIIGPRKEGDVSSDFARGIVRIERGEAPEMPVGNLTIVRDFLDVRDCVSGFWRIATDGKTGSAYNICSGKGISTGDLLELFRQNARAAVNTISDPAKLRRIDTPVKIGNPARLMALGWKPEIAIKDSARAILDYWRNKCKS